MKLELPVLPPEHIKEYWEGQFSVFSWYNFVINVPSPVFIITTLKENGLANAALSAWGMMAGSGCEPKFILQVHNYTESRKLIEKNGEFVINYPSLQLQEQFKRTVQKFDDSADEILASGLTHEPSVVVAAPRVAECFACLECKVDWIRDIETQVKTTTLVQASIVHASIDEAVLDDDLVRTHKLRSWVFHIQESINPKSGIANQSGVFTNLDFDNSIPNI